MRYPSISERLVLAADAETIWQIALAESAVALNVEGGSWIWKSSQPPMLWAESTINVGLHVWSSIVAKTTESTDPHVLRYVGTFSDILTYSVLAIPVQVTAWDGWLILVRDHRRQFAQTDLEYVNTIVQMAHTAFIGWQYHEKTSQTYAHHLQELDRLREVARVVGRADSPEKFFSEIGLRVAEVMDTDIAGLLLYDEAQQAFVARSPFVGIPDAWVQNYRIPVTEDSELGQRWNHARFYWLSDNAQSDRRVKSSGLASLAVALDVRQVLLVALETGNQHVGFIQIANPQNKTRFTEYVPAR